MNTAETSGLPRPENDPGGDSDRYRAVFFATQEALVIVDDDGRYVDANEAYARLLKSTRSAVIGGHFSDFMPPDRLREAEVLFAALKRGEPGVREFPLRAIDGTIVPCEWNIRAGFLPGLTLCSARDITERQKAVEELRASEARFRAAVSAVGSIVWTNTSDGRMEGDQPGWAGFTGQTVEQYRGYGWVGALHPEDAQPTIDAWNQAVAEHRMFVFEHRVRRNDGVYRLFSIRAVPVLNERGGVREWVGVHTDITDERNLTATLRTNESQFRFLTALDDATRPLTDPESVVQTAARMLGEYLGADNIAYCHFDADEETFHITGEYRSAGAPTAKGHYTLSQFGGALRDALRSNKPYVVSDVEADARTADTRASYRALGIRANVAVPLYKAGRLVASMGVHQLSPREWKLKEIDLLQQVANRCWESIERVRAEDDLRKQWHTFDTVLSHTPDFTYTFDLNGRFTYINRALLALWQKSLEEARGKNFFELDYPPELAARLQSQIQQVIETKALVRDHTPYTDLQGSTGHYEYIFFPVFSSDGRVEAVAGATRDVTEREKMARALAASEQKLQQVFAQAPVAVVVFRGRDFIVEMANPFYEAILSGRNLRGRRFADVAPEIGKHVWDAFYRVLDTGEPFVATDWYVPYDQNGDGEVEDHWFNVVYHPLREADGTVSGMVAVCSDVTVQVRARLELERANRELEEFAFVSSHDLQEPLRMVGIYTELLLGRYVPDDPTAKQYGAFIKEGVQRMEKLIRDLLTYSRVIYTDTSSGKIADLNESLQQALHTLENRIAETGVKVSAAPLPRVQADSAQLMHVFQNLISNSLKYRDAQRPLEVRVSAEQQNGDWIISVEDNGIGFEQQYAERIFGLFKRLHKEEYAGTGLGLAICQRIVERYGGRIWAEGRPGAGATFRFSLPGI